MEMESNENIPLWLALVPVAALVLLLGASVSLFGDGSSGGPNQIALLLAAGVAQLIGMRLGWNALQEAMAAGIGLAINACLILLMVGLLIGVWMLCGTAPSLIYFGLGMLEPHFFYPAACLICALVSLTIGSSWTTAGTVGLALVGISQVMGLSSEVTAGAVISGAYFGDKMSPLSDTTNLSPGIVGAELFDHIRHMVWTTFPSLLLALLMYSVLAGMSDATALPDSAVEATRAQLANQFRLGVVPLLPLALLLGMAVRGVPAYPALAAGSFAGVLVAVFYQSDATLAFADPEGKLPVAEALVRGVWVAMASGYELHSGNEMIDQLLSRGGMGSMLKTVWLIMAAMVFGASMERTGLLARIVRSLLTGVRGTGSLIATTVATCIGANIIAADQYMAIVLPGRMYRLEFERRGLHPVNLSRTLEDAGTMTSALVPWNTCGAFMAATLGVATFSYLPYAFLNLLNPIFAIAYGFFDIKIRRLEPSAAPSVASVAEVV
ncbi:MAG: Na+/H+ antiporter NhaC [Pseudomonadales bacterium]|jgi:NhaC family Na+:H+ antiporter